MSEHQGEAVERINGWTAPRLDRLADHVRDVADQQETLIADVSQIKKTLAKRDEEERQTMRDRIKELEGRPRSTMYYLGGPVVAVVIGAVLTHAHVF